MKTIIRGVQVTGQALGSSRKVHYFYKFESMTVDSNLGCWIIDEEFLKKFVESLKKA
jgi:hypothetical protein